MLLYINHCEAYSKTSCNLHHLHNFLLSLFQHRFLPGMLQDACRIFKRDHFVRTCSKSLHLLHLLSLAVRKLGACQVHSTSICCSPLTWKHIVTRFGPWPGPLCSAKGCIVFTIVWQRRQRGLLFGIPNLLQAHLQSLSNNKKITAATASVQPCSASAACPPSDNAPTQHLLAFLVKLEIYGNMAHKCPQMPTSHITSSTQTTNLAAQVENQQEHNWHSSAPTVWSFFQMMPDPIRSIVRNTITFQNISLKWILHINILTHRIHVWYIYTH